MTFEKCPQLTIDRANRKTVAGAGAGPDQIAKFSFWSLFLDSIGNWYALTVGKVYRLCIRLFVGGFVQDVKCYGSTTVSHQIHHLSQGNNKKSEQRWLWLNYATCLGVIIDLTNAL